MEITQANINHLDAVAILFDQYRQFYEQPPALDACKAYLQKRMTNEESVIFIAVDNMGKVLGFTQLYPSQNDPSRSAFAGLVGIQNE